MARSLGSLTVSRFVRVGTEHAAVTPAAAIPPAGMFPMVHASGASPYTMRRALLIGTTDRVLYRDLADARVYEAPVGHHVPPVMIRGDPPCYMVLRSDPSVVIPGRLLHIDAAAAKVVHAWLTEALESEGSVVTSLFYSVPTSALGDAALTTIATTLPSHGARGSRAYQLFEETPHETRGLQVVSLDELADLDTAHILYQLLALSHQFLERISRLLLFAGDSGLLLAAAQEHEWGDDTRMLNALLASSCIIMEAHPVEHELVYDYPLPTRLRNVRVFLRVSPGMLVRRLLRLPTDDARSAKFSVSSGARTAHMDAPAFLDLLKHPLCAQHCTTPLPPMPRNSTPRFLLRELTAVQKALHGLEG